MSARKQKQVRIVLEPMEGRQLLSRLGAPPPPPAAAVGRITPLAANRNVMYEPTFRGGPTYGQVVEQIFSSFVFPSGATYNGVSVTRDNVIAERVEVNDRGGWYVTVRARYSGSVWGVPVAAERVRVYYDNGGIRVDLGGIKGAIDTRSIGRYLKERLPRPGSIDPLPEPTKVKFNYTLWNDSDETVRFRLPSGKTYSLAPGKKGSYTYSGVAKDAKITVFNSGKTYTLNDGDHKFFDMTSENRVGLDLDYKQTQVKFSYTIVNRSGETVRFRLPSGKTYSLSPGKKGSYTYSGQAGNAKITVFNSGKSYTLRGGDHKFFDMTSEDRVGFDMNYKK